MDIEVDKYYMDFGDLSKVIQDVFNKYLGAIYRYNARYNTKGDSLIEINWFETRCTSCCMIISFNDETLQLIRFVGSTENRIPPPLEYDEKDKRHILNTFDIKWKKNQYGMFNLYDRTDTKVNDYHFKLVYHKDEIDKNFYIIDTDYEYKQLFIKGIVYLLVINPVREVVWKYNINDDFNWPYNEDFESDNQPDMFYTNKYFNQLNYSLNSYTIMKSDMVKRSMKTFLKRDLKKMQNNITFKKLQSNPLVELERKNLFEEILSTLPIDILITCAEKLKNKKTVATPVKPVQISTPNPKSTPTPKSVPKMGEKNVMLAHPYDPDKHAKKIVGWWMSEKYDGVRAKWNGQEMESRSGLIYTLPDFLTEQLESVTDEEGNPMELDGELWGGIDTFAFMSGLARRDDNNPELWKEVKYMVFDTPDTTIPFEERIKKIMEALKRAGKLDNIKIVKHIKFDPSKMVVYSEEEGEVPMNIPDELKRIEEKGGEGLVLRKPKSMYEFKKSQNMLKVKSWSFKEAIVYGYEAGKEGVSGKMLGMVGSLLVRSDQFGDEGEDEGEKTEHKWVDFKVGSGLNDWQRNTGEMKEELAKSKKWSTDQQKRLDAVRKKMIKPIDKTSESYKRIVETIKTATGKERSDALHELNDLYAQMPGISFNNIVTFRYKELTKDGNPSMPTFVAVRPDIDYNWEKRHE